MKMTVRERRKESSNISRNLCHIVFMTLFILLRPREILFLNIFLFLVFYAYLNKLSLIISLIINFFFLYYFN